MKVKVQASEILEYIKEGKDCKIEVNKQGEAYILPFEAYGFEDTILTQVFESYEDREFESDKAYIEWIKYAYDNTELTGSNGQLIKIKNL